MRLRELLAGSPLRGRFTRTRNDPERVVLGRQRCRRGGLNRRNRRCYRLLHGRNGRLLLDSALIRRQELQRFAVLGCCRGFVTSRDEGFSLVVMIRKLRFGCWGRRTSVRGR